MAVFVTNIEVVQNDTDAVHSLCYIITDLFQSCDPSTLMKNGGTGFSCAKWCRHVLQYFSIFQRSYAGFFVGIEYASESRWRGPQNIIYLFKLVPGIPSDSIK